MTTTITRNFGSWWDFVTSAADEKLRQYRRLKESHTTNYPKWYGTRTFNEAVEMALYTGWPEGRKMMADSYAIISPRPEPYHSETLSVAGMYPNIPAYISGSPECMVDYEYQNIATNPIIKVDYVNGGTSNISAKSLMLRGAAVLSLCDQLEKRGYSTEINLVSETNGGYGITRTTFIKRVAVKPAGEPIDLDRMAFALAQPAVHRRLHFALIEQHRELESIFGSSYGSTRPNPTTKRENVITIPGPSGTETPASARLAVAIAASSYLIDNNLSDLATSINERTYT